MQPAVAVESLTGKSAVEGRASDSYPTYPKGSSSQKLANRQHGIPLKSLILWILRPSVVILLICVFFFWTSIVNDQINHYTDDKIKWSDNRPSVAMNATNGVVISNNEYCNDIVREILRFNHSVEAAGRVMMHCLWLTEPHKTSPLGHNFFAVIDSKSRSNEVLHSINYAPPNMDFLRTLYTRRPVLQKRGIFSIGLTGYTKFLAKMKEMASKDSDDALGKMAKMTDDYTKIPIGASLKIALDRNRWDLPHHHFYELFDGLGNPKEIGDMLNGTQLMNSLANAASVCLMKNQKECSRIMGDHVNQTQLLYEDQLGRILQTLNNNHTISLLNHVLDQGSAFKVEPGLIAEVMAKYSESIRSPSQSTTVYSAFVIMRNTGEVVMGGSGLNSEFGAMTRTKDGMIYNNIMTMYDMKDKQLKEYILSLPLMDYDEKDKKLVSVSLMVAPRYRLLSDYLVNWVANRIGNRLSYSTCIRMPGLFVDPGPVSNEGTNQTVSQRVFLTEGTPPSVVDKMCRHKSGYGFEDGTWDGFPVDVLGVEVSRGEVLQVHMTSQKKQAAQLAGF